MGELKEKSIRAPWGCNGGHIGKSPEIIRVSYLKRYPRQGWFGPQGATDRVISCTEGSD